MSEKPPGLSPYGEASLCWFYDSDDPVGTGLDPSSGFTGEDVAWLVALADGFADPIMEVGCGTGRLLLPLARRGRRVWGSDTSEAMLACLRGKLADESADVRARVVLHRATGEASMPTAMSFGLVAFTFNLLMLAPSEDEQAALLAVAAAALGPDAGVVVDVMNARHIDAAGTATRSAGRRLDRNGRVYERFVGHGPLDDQGRFVVRGHYRLLDDDTLQPFELPMRAVTRSQLRAMVESTGLTVVAEHGDYRGTTWTPNATRTIIVAQRS